MLTVPADFDPKERGERAERIFNDGFNCCQAVVLAFSDLIGQSYGLDESVLASLCSGFGGGFGRLREVCGAVSGMTVMAGFIQPAADPSVKSDRTANYALVQEFAAAYRKQNGSIVCRELLGLQKPQTVSAAIASAGFSASPESPASSSSASSVLPESPVPSSAGFSALPESPVPSDRTPEYYRKRPCGKLVNMAAVIVATKLASAE